MLRRSRYVITVPGPAGEYLFVNTFSGAMIAGTEEVLKILNGDQKGDKETLSSLVSSGFLTEFSPKEETEAAFKKLESIRGIYRDHTLFVFILTYECNMRCSYCFQSYVFEKESAWLQQKMSVDQVDAAYKAVETLNPDTETPIHLFGGEPLIYRNYDLVKCILEKGTSEGKSFLIITNGLEADKFIPLFEKSNIVSLQITVDGTQEIHDRRKKKLDGTGTFQQITESVDRLADAGITVYLKTAVDHTTVKALPAFMEFVSDKGWIDNEYVIPFVTPVRHHTEGGCFNFMCNLEEADLDFLIEYEMIQEPFWRGLSPLAQKLGFIDNWIPQISFCRHNPSQTWFDPFGDIYLCTDSLGDKEHAVGTYYPELAFNEQYDQWKRRTTFDMRSCRHCRFAMICGGGCGHYTYHNKGGILKPDCSFSKQVETIYYPLLWRMIRKFRMGKAPEGGEAV